MTDELLPLYKQRLESWTLIPSDGGKYEVTIDGELVYSKLDTGEFPSSDQIKAEIDQRL